MLKDTLKDVYQQTLALKCAGKVATYIPELAKVDPEQFGLALLSEDDECFSEGDADVAFSIQSMSKVLTLAMALEVAPDELFKRVGVEPSGNPFNSLVQLENENGIPRNPLINAGALVVADILLSHFENPKDALLQTVSRLGQVSARFDTRVALSEYKTSARNRALANFMKSFGNIKNDIDVLLDFYCHQCALAMSCIESVKVFSFLSRDQKQNSSLSETQKRRINALMLTCGFYDESGDFAFSVGLPGKSGVGGGIVALCPSRFTIAAWSPRLGPKGNSLRATHALKLFANQTNSSIF